MEEDQEPPAVTNGDDKSMEEEVKRPKIDSSSEIAETREQENRSFASDTADHCESVKMLDQLIQRHKEVYSDEKLPKHFHGNVLTVARKCWEQVNQSAYNAMEAKFRSVLDEFTVKEKLTEYDKRWDESDPDQPAWRASGDPNLDSTEAEGVAIRGVVIPQFEEEYKQVSAISSELQEMLKKKQQKLKSLETEIEAEIHTLGDFVNTLP